MTSHLREDSFAPGQIIRKSLGFKEKIAPALISDYHSELVKKIVENGNLWKAGELTFRLASSFGFCYGVDRAVELAYEARERFPDKRIFLTAEIIHNPRVNSNLKEMGFHFLERAEDITKEDVVVLPAFGATAPLIDQVRAKGAIMVDTICGSVLNVWKRVESYAENGITAVIHGKYYHEETLATSSRVVLYPGGKYLIVLNMEEAAMVCDYIRQPWGREAFLAKFAKMASPGFDPDLDLKQVGVANQTTMLMSESLAIAEELRKALLDRYGSEHVQQHFRNFDTICSATEDRQNAILDLAKEKLDLMLVVGGYNSSNTNHLCKMASTFTKSFHIADASCLISLQEIRHKPSHQFEPIVSRDWIATGPLAIGITSGASTPNQVMGEVIERLIALRQEANPS